MGGKDREGVRKNKSWCEKGVSRHRVIKKEGKVRCEPEGMRE